MDASNLAIGGIILLGIGVAGVSGFDGTRKTDRDVVEACSLYGRYYVEPPSDTDPMGYYINCNVTGGPVIAPKGSKQK